VRHQELIKSVQQYHPAPDLDSIRRAYSFVKRHHQGQTRASGEPYVTHVTEVAHLATKLRLDEASILTALLHDTVEDTDATIEQLGAEFGQEVAELVDGVTKLSQVKFSSREEQQAENFRKMLLAMAQDIRVLLIKLCDRTHNMRTLEFLAEARRMRIAKETLDIYAPLAHRLGIHWMKSELEDLSFRFLKPVVYERIKEQVNTKREQREGYIAEVVKLLSRELEQNGVEGRVSGRPKHFYSIYNKMQQQGLEFDEIFDLIAFRILVDSTMQCYAALGVVHAAWKPIPGRFKDYIAMPKPNGYRSLHTTVIGPMGQRVEIQIRTNEMHDVAERGVAAHWAYKEGAEGGPKKNGVELTWLRDMIESEKLLRDPLEFISSVKDDLFPEEVFVFTPKGDVISLQAGSTPIDFAFAIHSEVGQHCSGARVNGQQVSLSHRLENGDTVEVSTSNKQNPSKDWLNIVASSKAKQRIRAWLKAEERKRSIEVGSEILEKDLRKVKQSLSKLTKEGKVAAVATDFGLRDEDSLFAEVGYGKLTPAAIITKLLPEEEANDEKVAKETSTIQKIFDRAARAIGTKSAIKVSGMDDVVFRFARCCGPLPGDELVGYVTRGRGVTIHQRGCPQTMSFDPQRTVPVEWADSAQTERPVRIIVYSVDKVGILALMSQCISGEGANIATVECKSDSQGKARSSFDVTVQSSTQLERITHALELIDGVFRVESHRGFKKSG